MAEKKSHSGVSVEGLQQALDALAAQLAALTARLEKLEAVGSATPAAAAAPVVEAPVQPVAEPVAAQPPAAEAAAAVPTAEPEKAADEFSAELLLVLSAAVAAYLGKRPHIRAVRLLGSSAWAQQGRVFVQASHQLNVPHEA
jgi:methylmalonyl-CoA carboxyltransferase large subunit